MAFEKGVSSFHEITKRISKLGLDSAIMDTIVSDINTLNESLMKHVLDSIKTTRGSMEYKCVKCKETNPLMFNRKKSECTPCMSKSGYEKLKVTLEKGKERNILARIARGECVDCKMKVTRDNALSFDWDHRNPAEKTHQVSRMNARTDELFYVEIEKCDLVCKNCHAIRTKYQFDNDLIPKRQCKKIENVLIDKL